MKKEERNFIEFCRDTELPSKKTDHISQSSYVMEECAELIQALNKEIRGYENSMNILGEIGDVICTIGVYCVLKGISYEEVMNVVDYKIKRALTQDRK